MRYNVVAIGGTFDIIHKGHKELIKKAFELGEKVYVGLTSDELAKKMGKKPNSYEERLKVLESFLSSEYGKGRYKIFKLNDYYGPAATDGEVEALVVSKETEERAIKAQAERAKRGLKPLKIIPIDLVLAYDGRPISTSRIKAKEIDENGMPVRN